MASLQKLKQRLLELKGKELILAKEVVTENLDVATDLIAGQLAQGLMKDGTKSDYRYGLFTIASKRNKSGLASVTDHLTNYNTGESYRKLYGKMGNDAIEFGTETDKEDSISERMEGKAFGLSPDSKTEFIRQHINPAYVEKIKATLKL